MSKILVAVLAFIGATLVFGEVEAATVEAMNLDEMSSRAEMIFVGRTVGLRSDWNAQHTRVYTYVRLEVERFLKGGAGEGEIVIRVLGGDMGGFRSIVPGTPRFVLDEEVLLFCAGTRARIPTVLGLALGKFSIATDSTGEKMLSRDITGLILADYRTDSRPVGTPPTRYRLSEVESRILASVAK